MSVYEGSLVRGLASAMCPQNYMLPPPRGIVPLPPALHPAHRSREHGSWRNQCSNRLYGPTVGKISVLKSSTWPRSATAAATVSIARCSSIGRSCRVPHASLATTPRACAAERPSPLGWVDVSTQTSSSSLMIKWGGCKRDSRARTISTRRKTADQVAEKHRTLIQMRVPRKVGRQSVLAQYPASAPAAA